jgi:hypothetical protein
MDPREYEVFVCEHFRQMGYIAEMTTYTNDYGVDIFATKGKERIAIQAKMYGKARKINRQMFMELHGAKDYFDCSKAVIVTDGEVLGDAMAVARKLNIEVIKLEVPKLFTTKSTLSNEITFEQIWREHIFPLEGKVLARGKGKTNEIVKVDWGQVIRRTSNGKLQKIQIEIFKLSINKLLLEGTITRDYINQNYVGRASSGVILILAQVPFFKFSVTRSGLTYEYNQRQI